MRRTHRSASPIVFTLILAVAALTPVNAKENSNGEVTVDSSGSQLIAGKESSYPQGAGGSGGSGSGDGGEAAPAGGGGRCVVIGRLGGVHG